MALVAQVLLDRELAVDARVLEDDAELAADVVRLRADVEAADARRAGGRGKDRREDAEERALPAAVRSEQREQLALAHLERHARERLAVAVAVAKIVDLDRGARHRDRRRRRSIASSADVTNCSIPNHKLLE